VNPFRQRQERPLSERAQQLRAQAAGRARSARRQLLLLTPLLAGILVLYAFRVEIFGAGQAVVIAIVIGLVIVGWAFARGLGRALGPIVDRRLERGTAGVVGFLVRLAALTAVVVVALRIAGLKPAALAVGASFTAVILGLAAQQTIGNVIAGVVLLSARPFSVGDRVQFEGFGFDVQGTVHSLGLLYVTLTEEDDVVLIPNSVVLMRAVKPLRGARGVDLRARLEPGTAPAEVEERLVDELSVTTRDPPVVALEEYDGERVTVRVTATPVDHDEGPRLAGEVLAILEDLGGTPNGDRSGEDGARPEDGREAQIEGAARS
jgi:small conductance mechanosensitive channel